MAITAGPLWKVLIWYMINSVKPWIQGNFILLSPESYHLEFAYPWSKTTTTIEPAMLLMIEEQNSTFLMIIISALLSSSQPPWKRIASHSI